MPHLDVGLIHELLDGEVSSEKLPPIQAHLSSCAACRALLDEERAMLAESDELIESLDEVAMPAAESDGVLPLSPRRVAQWPRQLAWAASLVLAVGLGYTARGGITPPVGTPAGPSASPTDAVRAEEALSTATAAESEIQGAASPAPESSTPARERDQSANRLSGEVAGAPPPPAPAAELGRQANRADRLAESPAIAGLRADTINAERRMEAAAQPVTSGRARAAEFADADDLAAGATPAAAKALGARDEARALDSIGVPTGALWRLGSDEPIRTAYDGDEVRLVYLHPMGEVTLVQRRVGSEMGWRIEVPASFPADSLAALRGRVR